MENNMGYIIVIAVELWFIIGYFSHMLDMLDDDNFSKCGLLEGYFYIALGPLNIIRLKIRKCFYKKFGIKLNMKLIKIIIKTSIKTIWGRWKER